MIIKKWAFFIETIGIKYQLPMWCIFKRKRYMDNWYSGLEHGNGHHISLSENRWTDNKPKFY